MLRCKRSQDKSVNKCLENNEELYILPTLELTMWPGILQLCSLFVYLLIPKVAGQCCRILGLLVLLVLSHHHQAEKWGSKKAKSFQMAWEFWTSHLQLPVAFHTGSSWRLFSFILKKPSDFLDPFGFLSPSVLFKEKTILKVDRSTWSWALLGRRWNRMCYLKIALSKKQIVYPLKTRDLNST